MLVKINKKKNPKEMQVKLKTTQQAMKSFAIVFQCTYNVFAVEKPFDCYAINTIDATQ